ncbi:MAG: hypothetical protein RIQ33_316, partial [Bacteroidota bacterium]
ATFKANDRAKNTNIPLILEENNALYEISPDGTKRFIKNIEKPQQLPAHFKLK